MTRTGSLILSAILSLSLLAHTRCASGTGDASDASASGNTPMAVEVGPIEIPAYGIQMQAPTVIAGGIRSSFVIQVTNLGHTPLTVTRITIDQQQSRSQEIQPINFGAASAKFTQLLDDGEEHEFEVPINASPAQYYQNADPSNRREMSGAVQVRASIYLQSGEHYSYMFEVPVIEQHGR